MYTCGGERNVPYRYAEVPSKKGFQMNIPFVDLKAQYSQIHNEIDHAIGKVVSADGSWADPA